MHVVSLLSMLDVKGWSLTRSLIVLVITIQSVFLFSHSFNNTTL